MDNLDILDKMMDRLDELALNYMESEDQAVKNGIEAEFRIHIKAYEAILDGLEENTPINFRIEKYIKNRNM